MSDTQGLRASVQCSENIIIDVGGDNHIAFQSITLEAFKVYRMVKHCKMQGNTCSWNSEIICKIMTELWPFFDSVFFCWVKILVSF